MYNPQEEKNKPSFLKKIFLLSLYFSSLWPPFLLSIQTFWKKPQSFFFLPIPLSLLLIYYYSATHKKKKTDLPTLLIYILLILLFLLHHNIDAFKRNGRICARTNFILKWSKNNALTGLITYLLSPKALKGFDNES